MADVLWGIGIGEGRGYEVLWLARLCISLVDFGELPFLLPLSFQSSPVEPLCRLGHPLSRARRELLLQ